MICSPLYELVGFGDGVGVLGSCDHGLLFMFDCDFLGCICLIRVFVWCVVVPRLGKRGVWVWDDSLCKI